MNCAGIDIVHPVDRMPEATFPFLQNVRVVKEGTIEARPGYTLFGSVAANLHSLRRLNDTAQVYAPNGYIYVAGAGGSVYAGIESGLANISSGFSGNPLSLLPFRPDVSPVSWMYVYDEDKQIKVRPDGTVREIGTPPALPILDAEYGIPLSVNVDTGQAAVSWTQSGSAGAPTNQVRMSNTPEILVIKYNTGSTGWACIYPIGFGGVALLPSQMGERMKVILNAGGGNAETVIVREIHPAITQGGSPTTIAGIRYDTGSTGLCTIVLGAAPEGGNFSVLARNSLLLLGGTEYVRVLSVTLSPDGSTYSLRCSTTGTFAAAATVDGVMSWYVYTVNTHVSLELITSTFVQSVNGTAGVSVGTLTQGSLALNLASAGGRPISEANDYFHISLYVTQPQNVAFIELRAYLTSGSGDYWSWIITPAILQPNGGWTDLSLPFASGTRNGNHPGSSLALVNQLTITVNWNDVGTFGFDWWYLFGTYGPEIAPGSPIGYSYVARNRDSTTGVAGLPSPITRFQLNPLRESVIVTPGISSQAGIDSIDIYRQGGTLDNFTYVGTTINTAGTTFTDNVPDANLAAAPLIDLTLVQPWPIQDVPWTGTVNVVGTSVTWVSGHTFTTSVLPNTIILINGVAHQIAGQPSSTTRLELVLSAGVQNAIAFQVQNPILAAQTLPFVFGTLEGPLAPVAFGLGDPLNPGTLYWTNTANLDGASDKNTLEVCPPSEALISGAVWNGLVIVGSRENLFLVRYSYLQTLDVPGPLTFQFSRLPSPSGMWSRWSCTAGQDGVYFLGRDGIYRANETGAVSVTDERLYSLFPHDGQAASGANGLLPVDMTALPSLRLIAADQDLYFDYRAVGD